MSERIADLIRMINRARMDGSEGDFLDWMRMELARCLALEGRKA